MQLIKVSWNLRSSSLLISTNKLKPSDNQRPFSELALSVREPRQQAHAENHHQTKMAFEGGFTESHQEALVSREPWGPLL
jgi:hypothetical protein